MKIGYKPILAAAAVGLTAGYAQAGEAKVDIGAKEYLASPRLFVDHNNDGKFTVGDITAKIQYINNGLSKPSTLAEKASVLTAVSKATAVPRYAAPGLILEFEADGKTKTIDLAKGTSYATLEKLACDDRTKDVELKAKEGFSYHFVTDGTNDGVINQADVDKYMTSPAFVAKAAKKEEAAKAAKAFEFLRKN